jgi:hypothetical protein
MDNSGNEITDLAGNQVKVQRKGKKKKIYIVEASSSESEDETPVSNDIYKKLQAQKKETH